MKIIFVNLNKSLLAVSALVMGFALNQAYAQIDDDATAKTKALYSNLKKIQNSSMFLFGQEFFNSFRYSSGSPHGNKESSDSEEVTGAHPAVLGSDFHYYLEKDATERNYHTEAVKWAYQQGMIITFDWHLSARNTTSYACNGAPAGLAKNIANENDETGDRAWYFAELDDAIDIINNDLRVGNDTIPVIFRPLHEMNGGWFWWGNCSGLTNAEYIDLFQQTVSYIKERTNSVLFCWSPNTPFNLNRYPGDEYVDVIGVDAYEVTISTLRTQVGLAVDQAVARDKVAAFTETGNRTDDGMQASAYWKDVILPGIANDSAGKAQKVAWVLTWINSSWSYPYVPHTNSSAAAKQSFIDFKSSPYVVFADELPDMYDPNMETPQELITSIDTSDLTSPTLDIQVYPHPSEDKITISLYGFKTKASISIFDSQGKLVREMQATNSEVTFRVGELNAGVYMFKVSDGNQTVNRKLLIK